jgi:uncharacterized membrane protein
VIAAYIAFGLVLALALVTFQRRGSWREAHGLDRLLLLGPAFYAAPLAGFGTEHFTLTATIASLVPQWIPWHSFWAYLVGACFIAAALSLVTGVQARLAASMLAVTFFLFVALMDVPAWAHDPRDQFALTIALRELAFSGGALALASRLAEPGLESRASPLATLARGFVAVPVLFFSLRQFVNGDHVPAVPLNRLTPDWLLGHAIWTYAAAGTYAVAGTLLFLGIGARAAAVCLGLAVLFVELVVYLPIAVVERASLGNGFNYLADTLMFAGAVLLLASALPAHEAEASLAPSPQLVRKGAP